MSLHKRMVHVHSEGIEGEDIVTVALPVKPTDASAIVQADLTDGATAIIGLTVYDKNDPYGVVWTPSSDILAGDTALVGSGIIVWAGAVQQGFGMPNGYVFCHVVTPANFTQKGGRTYILEYRFTTDLYGTAYIVHERKAHPRIAP